MPAPEPGERWGIFGGVFDPVHLGHINLARDIHKSRRLDGVLFTPAFSPPHRPDERQAPFEDRVAMLRLALADFDRFEVSRVEEEAGPPGYTLHTVRRLKTDFPEVTFYFLMGADNLGSLKNWHQWMELLKEISLLVGYRPGFDRTSLDDLPEDRIEMVQTGMVDMSSTAVRAAIKQGVTPNQLADMVPLKVTEYMLKKRLYS